MKRKNILILGAAGRDYHNFLVCFKDNPQYQVVGFTQAQIPGIEKRSFPKSLAGRLYKKNIPFYPEEKLAEIIPSLKVDEVVLAYSDLSHKEVMDKASIVLAAGANFCLLGPKDTQIKSKKPVVSITAVRTGCGKSPASRKVAETLLKYGLRVVAIRHPMPYGSLKEQEVERFATYEDLKKYKCTIEEREEYEPWIELGIPIYAGVDYEKIIKKAEKEADVIIWDGGNNDFSFYKPDLNIVLVDPHRPGHEMSYYPGEVNFRSADVIIISKMKSAMPEGIAIVKKNINLYNPKAEVIEADLKFIIDQPELIKGKNVLVVEDGPTLTHGGMSYGAGYLVAQKYGGKIVDGQLSAVGSMKLLYKKYMHLKKIVPAMGYSPEQIKELEETINKAHCEVVIDGTPVNLRKLLKINKPIVTVSYVLEELGETTMHDVLKRFAQ
ncbi:MAG: cyclic 2,3-diphosphoglycerate synthase [Candidatus Woesearchaeota archaeon]|nr:cyclic 2,3-diphosphoglycerate synthase [Candidatus Woesearchaeota archaeon]